MIIICGENTITQQAIEIDLDAIHPQLARRAVWEFFPNGNKPGDTTNGSSINIRILCWGKHNHHLATRRYPNNWHSSEWVRVSLLVRLLFATSKKKRIYHREYRLDLLYFHRQRRIFFPGIAYYLGSRKVPS